MISWLHPVSYVTPAKAVLSAGSQQPGISVGLSPSTSNTPTYTTGYRYRTCGISVKTEEFSNVNKETDKKAWLYNNYTRPWFLRLSTSKKYHHMLWSDHRELGNKEKLMWWVVVVEGKHQYISCSCFSWRWCRSSRSELAAIIKQKPLPIYEATVQCWTLYRCVYRPW